MDRKAGRKMRAGVIQRGAGSGARKATVVRLRGFLGVEWAAWAATHDCGWWEQTTYWHNAFWAADHHMRYDCGRREQPSSGDYEMVGTGPGEPARPVLTARKVEYQVPMSEEQYRDLLADAQAAAPFWQRAGEVMDRYLNEGGVQNDPTPSDTGDPLPPESAEDPTVELGAITTELGPVPDEWAGSPIEGMTGSKPGIDGATWWGRLWGRHAGQR